MKSLSIFLNESEVDAFDVLFSKGMDLSSWGGGLLKDFGKDYFDDWKTRRKESKEDKKKFLSSLSEKEQEEYKSFEAEEDKLFDAVQEYETSKKEVSRLKKNLKNEKDDAKKAEIQKSIDDSQSKMDNAKSTVSAQSKKVQRSQSKWKEARQSYKEAGGKVKDDKEDKTEDPSKQGDESKEEPAKERSKTQPKEEPSVSADEVSKDVDKINKLADKIANASPEEKDAIIKKAQGDLDSIKQKHGMGGADEEKSKDKEPKGKKEIEKALTKTQGDVSKWTGELGKMKNKKSKTAKDVQDKINRGNEKINKYTNDLKSVKESFIKFVKPILEGELEDAIKKLETAMKPSKSQEVPKEESPKDIEGAVKNLETAMEPSETQEVPDGEEVEELPAEGEEGAMPTELELTSQPLDPMTQQQLPEPPEDKDYTLKPFSEKQSMVISFLKEYGYSNFDVKINDGANHILVTGEVNSEVKNGITSLADEIELIIDFEDIEIEKDKHITKLIIKNKMTLDKFMDVFKIIQRQKQERKNDKMSMGIN